MIECRKMTNASLPEAFELLKTFLTEDEHYIDSRQAYGGGGSTALQRALELFLCRSELGFIWMTYDGKDAIGVCVVCFAISTSVGTMVAKLDDVFVRSNTRRKGVGSTLLMTLKIELRQMGVRRMDTGVHHKNASARRFYEKNGFVPLNEERLACVI